ncbi:preprotein translocase subunit SecD [Natronomonas salina]|uniref:preprotein translocase subunit SecD n=1 Tax=Natronomonas salina TaxID=1710540 RepID=UPI0015B4C299|nr:preprotein translocase subunit SecD [Natronomonas salina]QLD90432.1 preprotein translocase subunit SecD [Natronomonas salina]
MKLQLKKHWRIWLLVLFVVLSSVAVFAPTGGAGGGDLNETNGTDSPQGTSSQYTNLRFGLDLSGGTQVRAPLIGMTVTGLEIDDPGATEQTLQSELDLGAADVDADAEEGAVEIYTDHYVNDDWQSQDEAFQAFAAALQEAGYSVSTDDVRMGVTSQTRDTAEERLTRKISEGGLPGGEVSQVAQPGSQHLMVVEVPGANRTAVRERITDRGQVETVALFPDPETGEYRTESLIDQGDFANIGGATQDSGQTFVPVTLTQEAGPRFGQAMRDYGFDQQGGTNCNYNYQDQSLQENIQRMNESGQENRCLLTVVDGEVVYGSGIAPSLSSSFRDGSFDENPRYQTNTPDLETARQLELDMRTGALPTTLDIENRGTEFYLQPSLAERFKPLSLATGAVAVLAVAMMVFLRYRRPEVALPMTLTAGAEVFILLGFAAAVSLPLDLSHIAGFIAVIGTGVDDLVIIADEIMQQGEVKTSRVFESRFRKAFWVIGAAAATTIIAMSPLAVLSLGELRGFAIVTIVGVLIGVLITRPAYGDILRILVLEDE